MTLPLTSFRNIATNGSHTWEQPGSARPARRESEVKSRSTLASPTGIDPVVIFLHLYKTGGTTLNRIIEWEYDVSRICSVEPNGWQYHYDRIRHWPAWRLNRIAIFKGHMPFGLHTVLEQPAVYITILRDPIERAISDYYFARSFKAHAHHHAAKHLSFEEYFVEKHEHNLQSKILAGPDSADTTFEKCSLISAYTRLRGSYSPSPYSRSHILSDSDLLRGAKANLDRHFAVVGITERYEETLALFKVVFGWTIKHYKAFRITAGRLSKTKLPASILELIREHERYDLSLYEYGRSLFERAVNERKREVEAALVSIHGAGKMTALEKRYYFLSSVSRAFLSRLYSSL